MTDEDLKKIRGLIQEELKPVTEELNNPEFGLKALNTKVEDNIAELSEVHKLAGATYDLVKLEPQKRKQEINEIREHVGLSPLPSE